MRKTDKIFVRYGFEDKVMSVKSALSDSAEICACESFLVGYEDEHGEECDQEGVYFDQKEDPNQLKIPM